MTLCGRCGEALDMEGVRFAGQFPVEGLLCSPCRMAPPEFERAVAYAVYQDELREMVHLLKYERMSAVARPLGRMLARAIEMIEVEAGEDLLVVAVPLFPSKERERGYNQAVLIADAALAELKRSRPEWRLQAAHGVIRRVKDTRSQFELTPKGRRRNLQGAFAVADGCGAGGARGFAGRRHLYDRGDGAGMFASPAAGWSEQGLGGDGVAGAAGDGGGLGCGFDGSGFADGGLGCWIVGLDVSGAACEGVLTVAGTGGFWRCNRGRCGSRG